jgi:diguanylate cyclase (GGDEF)-like protein
MPALVDSLFPDILRFSAEQGLPEAEMTAVHNRAGLDLLRREMEQVVFDIHTKVAVYVCVGRFSLVQSELERYRGLAQSAESLTIFGEKDIDLPASTGITLVPVNPPRLSRDYFCVVMGEEYLAALLAGQIPGDVDDERLKRYNAVLTSEGRVIGRALDLIHSILLDEKVVKAPALPSSGSLVTEAARQKTRTLLMNRLAIRVSTLARQLERNTAEDPLTGLANQERFYAALLVEANRFTRTQRPFSVLYIDMIEEELPQGGMAAGVRDQAIRSLGELLTEVLRKGTDAPFKLRGNEFGVILEETDDKQAARVALRIEEKFKQLRLPGVKLKIGVSRFSTAKEVTSLMEYAGRRQREGA